MKLFRSMRYTVAFIMGVIILLICAAVIGYRVRTLTLNRNQAADSIETMINLYLGGLDSYIESTEYYLSSQSLVGEQRMRLKDPKSQLEHYLAEVTIMNELNETIGDHKYLDGIFLYEPRKDIFLYGKQDYVNWEEVLSVRSGCTDILEQFQRDGYGKWYFVRLGEETYYMRTLVNNRLYTGGWINLAGILQELEELCAQPQEYIVIFDDRGQAVAGNYPGELPKYPNHEEVLINHQQYRAISGESMFGFSAVLYKKMENLTGSRNSLRVDVLMSVTVVLLLVLILLFLLNNIFVKPLFRIAGAMERLQNGDFQVTLAENDDFEEFRMIHTTFDKMVAQIEALKINVYEEKLHQQAARLQYLQLQINPHFLTNCLNLIHSLSILNRKELEEEAIFLLSRHIRYSMNTKTTVSLEQELEHVQNYVDLQKLRYDEHLRWELTTTPLLRKAAIPCMLIQTFVENAVKHQMTPEGELCITVNICQLERVYGFPSLYITIKDTGDGFDEKILEQIRQKKVVEKVDGEHIGIYNAAQRLDILYGNKAEIIYGNQEEGGAVIEIYIPLEVQE